ncbi:MAG: helix-turn-helix domain-containing protein [Actinomycetota bacterium]|jgi:hypothetical protein|nr:helix-turn-helix domain-containing protein [Actinomycetota bacterium]
MTIRMDEIGGDPVAQLLSRPVGQLLRKVAAEVSPQADDIAHSMILAYDAEIPAYAAISDQALRDDIQSVSSAMVRCWLAVMSTGVPMDAELLETMTEGARRRAVQGVDMQSMLRAYRVGIRVMWGEITASPLWRSQALQGSLAQVASWALDFADRISSAVAAAYLDESNELARQRAHRRSALLDVILSAGHAEVVDRPVELCRRHSVAAIRVAPDLTLRELERAGDVLEAEGGAVLWTVRHRSLVAIIDWPATVGRDQLCLRLARLGHGSQIEAIGLGGMAENVTETRQSYAEAVAALRVGSAVAQSSRPVFDFQDLAPLIALLERPEQARRFAAAAIEPVGDIAKRPWVLPTLEAYLTYQGHLKEVATALGVHPNTVKYRLRELRATTGAVFAVGDQAAMVLLALKVRRALESDLFGPALPCPAPERWALGTRSELP